ncbi:alpha/beta-hydrolase [Terfezia boudieri ATCC MYA-4762]|uniref:Alpha/beta-hydrolase n=1 Tax=Terfezia boudieri ATCC MYA-4762 TaxID=1051890 RepID=A0A3N4LWL8_9PEZI|nr:alpha/beta-hydrolase [Terfezia boudieri ATCC MYA-4762]
MLHHPNQNPAFKELDRLADYLSTAANNPIIPGADLPTGTVDPKRYPIVLVPGFLGWASPVFGYNYFGGLVNLAEILARRGWSVICPEVGPVSSNWERACELYAQLSRGSMDGTTYDIQVDYGVPPPGTDVFYSYPPPLRRQASCFNLPPTWRWSPSSPVHFIAHSQGGNTCRYLIHLLERGWSAEGSSYFTEPKLGWVKSLTTLATPHNGTSIIPVLEALTDLEDVLIDKIICAASFMQQKERTYDFCLDHRGLSPPPPPKDGEEEEAFLKYIAQMSAPDGPLTRWRRSTYNGFHDNSIIGVVGDLNKIITKPSEDVYYFTLSFAATVEVPELRLEMEDMLALSEVIVRRVGGWFEKLGLGGVLEKVVGLAGTGGEVSPPGEVEAEAASGVGTPTSVSTTQGLVDKLPEAVSSRLPTSFLSKINISSPTHSKPPPAWASTAAIPSPLSHASRGLTTAYHSAFHSAHAPTTTSTPTTASTRRFLLGFLTSVFGPTLQGIATFALSRLNLRLAAPKSSHTSITTLPIPIPAPHSTIPRLDLNPLFLPVAYQMCGYVLSPTEKELISTAGGPTLDAVWREHDGVVPTVSMCGPFGEENLVVSVGDIVSEGHVGMEKGGRGLKGKWVDLGKCAWWDHADCIGSCVNPVTVAEVVNLYERIGRLLSVLPVDRSEAES